MPRNHDRRRTPPHLRRAPKGSTVMRFPSGFHTLESFQHFATLKEQLRVNSAETLRQALSRAVHVEALVPVALMAGMHIPDVGWHLAVCTYARTNRLRESGDCVPECSAVRLALQELGALKK